MYIELWIITITSFGIFFFEFNCFIFTSGNYCVGMKLDSEIGQLAIIGYLKLDSYISQSYQVDLA